MSPKWVVLESNLAKYSPTGVIYVRKSFRRHRIPNLNASTGFKTINKAKARAQTLEAEHLNYYLHGIRPASGSRFGSAKTVSDVIQEFLKHVTPYNRRSGTQKKHGYYLKELEKEWGWHPIDQVTMTRWNDWLEKFRARKRRQTFDDYAIQMNMLLSYAHEKDYTRKLVRISYKDQKKETGRVFTTAETDKLYSVMSEETRDQFLLSLECGMRLREVLHLRWDRVNLVTGEITFTKDDVKTGSRTGKGRSFYVTEDAHERLLKRREASTIASPYVFPSKDGSRPINQNKTAWRAAKRRAGIKGKARWHDLRHTFLTRCLLDHKLSPSLVSKYAGVSARTIDRVYLHSTAEQTREVSRAIRIFKAI